MIDNKSSIINKIIYEKKLTFISCLLSVIVLPVYVYYLPPLMILWGLSWLIENNFKFKKSMFLHNKPAVLFILFITLVLWQMVGLFYAHSLSSGLERMVKRLSFILFPLVLFCPSDIIVRKIKLFIRLFAIFTLIHIAFCFGNAIHNSLHIQEAIWKFNPHPVDYDYENFFFGNRFSVLIHPSYLAMYVLLSLLISFEFVTDKTLKVYKRMLWSIAIVVFLIVLYLLSSRSSFLAVGIVIPLFFFLKYYKKLPRIVTLLFVILLITSIVFAIRQHDRIKYSKDGVTKGNITEVLKNDIRYSIWKSAYGVIKHNFVLGVGTGDASDALKKEFITRGYVNGLYDNLNAHNQYLETLLENGIIGLFIFLSILGYMIYITFSEKNLLFGMFILMILIFFFFETILNRLSGISFFALFSFLLIYFKTKVKP